MHGRFEAFISEVTSAPQYLTGIRQQPHVVSQMQAFEHGLRLIEQRATDDPAMLDCFDEICCIVDRGDLSMKQRILAVVEVLRRLCDVSRSIN